MIPSGLHYMTVTSLPEAYLFKGVITSASPPLSNPSLSIMAVKNSTSRPMSSVWANKSQHIAGQRRENPEATVRTQSDISVEPSEFF